MTKIAVLGSGSFGTSLAHIYARKGIETCLWARDEKLAEEINTTNRNSRYLPELKLHPELRASGNAKAVLQNADIVLSVIPSQFTRCTLTEFREYLPSGKLVVCASKGIELNSLKLMPTVLEESLRGLNIPVAQLSGPSFAGEMIEGQPTSVVLGCSNEEAVTEARDILSTDNFRVYSSTDLIGVGLGGAVKNVIAIATGICDGLGFQDNARAAIITRGLAEMSRLGVAMGARKETFMGLSGMGDLVLTCSGDQSRNKQVGIQLGQGMDIKTITSSTCTVAEGVKTTQALYELGKAMHVELPITAQVYSVLYNNTTPEDGVKKLMSRSLKDE
ncbi:MAG: NAD(P)H-dependent glycerol-3-phosphate dehydrogenase [Desulfovibrio sp.]